MKMTKGKTTIQELRKQERPLKAPKETNRGKKINYIKVKAAHVKAAHVKTVRKKEQNGNDHSSKGWEKCDIYGKKKKIQHTHN